MNPDIWLQSGTFFQIQSIVIDTYKFFYIEKLYCILHRRVVLYKRLISDGCLVFFISHLLPFILLIVSVLYLIYHGRF